MELRKTPSCDYQIALEMADRFFNEWEERVTGLPCSTARIDVDLFAFQRSDKPQQQLTIFDTEGDTRTRLSNMMKIGRLFGASKWKREFAEHSGTFSYTTQVETPTDHIHLKYVNAAQGKCTIIKTTEMVEKVTYKADCGGQMDEEINIGDVGGMVQ